MFYFYIIMIQRGGKQRICDIPLVSLEMHIPQLFSRDFPKKVLLFKASFLLSPIDKRRVGCYTKSVKEQDENVDGNKP